MTGSKNDVGSNWNIRAAGSAKRETEEDRTTFNSEYYFQTADGTQTDNNFLAQILQEYMFKGSKWEVFLQSTYQNDEFQAWEQRIGLYAGPGYRLFEGDVFKMKLRGGFGASYEFPTETWTPEILLGEELAWKIDDRSQLTHGFEIYPDVEQFGEYRFLARIDYEIALTAKKDLRATAGVRDVFDSYVEPGGDSTNDLKMYVGLKYEF
jgi:putative salt-induced outer membrane protein YdiY